MGNESLLLSVISAHRSVDPPFMVTRRPSRQRSVGQGTVIVAMEWFANIASMMVGRLGRNAHTPPATHLVETFRYFTEDVTFSG